MKLTLACPSPAVAVTAVGGSGTVVANTHAAPDVRVVVVASDERGRSVRRQRVGVPELRRADLAVAGQLRTLLAPGVAGAREQPGGSGLRGVLVAADQRDAPVGRHRHAAAEPRVADCSAADARRRQLAPCSRRACEPEGLPAAAVVCGSPDEAEVPVCRERHAPAEVARCRSRRWRSASRPAATRHPQERVNTHAAPTMARRRAWPPMSAVFPSADSATSLPNQPEEASPVPVSLLTLLRPDARPAGEHPRRAHVWKKPSFGPPIRAVFAVCRQRHVEAEPRPEAALAGTGQLAALLRPDGGRAREHPRRSGLALSPPPPISAVFPSDDSATAEPKPARAGRACADQLAALLRPGRARPGEHPCRSDVAVVRRAADQRRIPVGRQCDRVADLPGAGLVARGELVARLDERVDRDRIARLTIPDVD